MFLHVENVVKLALVMTNNFCFFAEESSGSKLSRCLYYTPITVQQFSEKRISTVTCRRERRDSPTRFFRLPVFFHLSNQPGPLTNGLNSLVLLSFPRGIQILVAKKLTPCSFMLRRVKLI